MNQATPIPELVHPIPVDEIPAFSRAMATTFHRDPDAPETARRTALLTRVWEPSRAWGVRDGDRWVATLRTQRRLLSVPGVAGDTRDLPADAVTNVTVAATHRRRGLMRTMLESSLTAAHERGDPFSILIAAEWPIYGRFGYGPATVSADYVLHRSRPGATCAGDPARLRQVGREEFGEVAPGVFAAARRLRAGQLERDRQWWNAVLGSDGYPVPDDLSHNWFVHEGDHGPDGLLSWKATRPYGLVPPLGSVAVRDLISAGDTAYRNIWSYLAGIDGVDEITVSDRPVDEPVRWLLEDGRALRTAQQVDFLWVRLLDVPAALEGRRYAVPGEVVLGVSDPAPGGFAAGRYRLSVDHDTVACVRTERAPDLELPAAVLSSIFLGGFRLSQLALAGRISEHKPGAIALVDLMFSVGIAPWNTTWF